MPLAAWVLTILGVLFVPTMWVSYLYIRVRARHDELLPDFGTPAVLPAYLKSRGHQSEQFPGESAADCYRRLRPKFEEVFEQEFKREYGLSYIIPACLATLYVSIVVLFLVTDVFDVSYVGFEVPTPVRFALLGAILWSIMVLIHGWMSIDIQGSTFFWISFRMILAVVVGLFAGRAFTGSAANGAALGLAMLPVATLIRSAASYLGRHATPEDRTASPFDPLQGINRVTSERLRDLGVATVQQLAYSDPLDLLFRTNFAFKAVVDWIDQALLYIYVGDAITKLRVRGIRGAIELAALHRESTDDFRGPLAHALGVTLAELKNLCESFYFDNQVALIWQLWGESDYTLLSPGDVSPENDRSSRLE